MCSIIVLIIPTYFMSNSEFSNEWPWNCKFGKSLLVALLLSTRVSYIPHIVNFRSQVRPDPLTVQMYVSHVNFGVLLI